MANLRQLLKEYLELDTKTIEEVINQCNAEWSAIVYQKLPDEQASEIMEQILGIPDWTKTRP